MSGHRAQKSLAKKYKNDLRAVRHQRTHNYGRNGGHNRDHETKIERTFRNPSNHSTTRQETHQQDNSGFKNFTELQNDPKRHQQNAHQPPITNSKELKTDSFADKRKVVYNGDATENEAIEDKVEQHVLFIDEEIQDPIFTKLMEEKKAACDNLATVRSELDEARKQIFNLKGIIQKNPCKWLGDKWAINEGNFCFSFAAKKTRDAGDDN